MSIYSQLKAARKTSKKLFAVLVDPDKTDERAAETIAKASAEAGVDFLFVGSSLLMNSSLDSCLQVLKKHCSIPLVLFPGNTMQISDHADAILFLSLISGRNADMLIGKQVLAAPLLKTSSLEVVSTGYMLIDPGHLTSVTYMSNTLPIPHDKNDIAVSTAWAGELLGLKLLYMDAGSGARHTISRSMIEAVSKNVDMPLIVGGGIKTPEKALELCTAGADVIVVGNYIEKDPGIISEIADAIHSFQVS
ncbi:MAG: geranylgeranylglyceryl/heptaprenylglyceryl phosphate synthase [Bacteroidetes bacterium]|nr:geranylgeranylglyceryl/heptaprenylglyceryl phosphate synthase [Bacteroidota bacterium]